jgi:hypothetical protein
MKEEQEYIRDIAEIRSMMERSSRFLSLSGWAGILAGIYALAGAYIAYSVFGFQPDAVAYRAGGHGGLTLNLTNVILLALTVLLLSISTAIVLSARNANKKGEKVWNATSRRLLSSMAVPLVTGGILILVLMAKDLLGLVAPLTLVFYGLALYSASKFTFYDVKYLGLIQVALGLISAYFIEWSLVFWALGFGVVHILYGIFIYYKYERR